MERLAPAIMKSFALALEQPEDYFADRIDRHITNSSVIHYPRQPSAPAAGEARAGAHSDLGSLTIIYSDTDIGGIEVLTRDDGWFRVPARARRAHGQPRRPDGGVDQRPMGLHQPSGREPAARAGGPGADFALLLPPAEL